MLDTLGRSREARAIEAAIEGAVKAGEWSRSTAAAGAAVLRMLNGKW
jgi:hypothetical protein